jgi:hypothetical protein
MAYPGSEGRWIDKTFVSDEKLRTFNFKLIVMRYCCYRWGTAQPTFSI